MCVFNSGNYARSSPTTFQGNIIEITGCCKGCKFNRFCSFEDFLNIQRFELPLVVLRTYFSSVALAYVASEHSVTEWMLEHAGWWVSFWKAAEKIFRCKVIIILGTIAPNNNNLQVRGKGCCSSNWSTVKLRILCIFVFVVLIFLFKRCCCWHSTQFHYNLSAHCFASHFTSLLSSQCSYLVICLLPLAILAFLL